MDTYYYAHSCSAKDFDAANFIYPVAFPNGQANTFKSITDKLNIEVCYEPEMNQDKTHSLITVYTSIDALDEVKKWLSQHPDVLYYQSKPVATELTGVAAKTGYGSPEKNRFSSICMVLDGYHKNEIKYMLLKAQNPEYFKYSLKDIREIGAKDVQEGKSKGIGTSSFGCPASDLDRIFDNAQHYNIPICINEEKLFYNEFDSRSGISDFSYTLTFPSSHAQEINSLLEQLSVIDSRDRLVPQNDLENYNYNYSPTAQYTASTEQGNNVFGMEDSDR